MVQKEFITILEKHGVKKIESINKKFDKFIKEHLFFVYGPFGFSISIAYPSK